MARESSRRREKKAGVYKQQNSLFPGELSEAITMRSNAEPSLNNLAPVVAEQAGENSQTETAPHDFPKLIILPDKMVYYRNSKTKDVFFLKNESKKAKRASIDQKKLEKALRVALAIAKNPSKIPCYVEQLDDEDRNYLRAIADSIGPGHGRAVAIYLIEQLAIKWAHPAIDIRLHKQIWQGGVSLRSIGQKIVVPFLRNNEVIAINKFGPAMTRSLAENYPFTPLYMADVKGATREWLELVERVQYGEVKPFPALVVFMSFLMKNNKQFNSMSEAVLGLLHKVTASPNRFSLHNAYELLTSHINQAPSKARLLEVAIHSLFQALEDLGSKIGGRLRPLMQMRTANRKHGNFGDVEIEEEETGRVRVAYDAKLGGVSEADLMDLKQKFLEAKEDAGRLAEIWFVYHTPTPNTRGGSSQKIPSEQLLSSLEKVKKELLSERKLEVDIYIKTLEELAHYWMKQVSDTSRSELPRMWLTAYVESLCLKRKEKAPIEEPTYAWLMALKEVLSGFLLAQNQ